MSEVIRVQDKARAKKERGERKILNSQHCGNSMAKGYSHTREFLHGEKLEKLSQIKSLKIQLTNP